MVTESISRQAAIKAFYDLPNCRNGYSDTYDKAFIIGVLEELPPLDEHDVVAEYCQKRGLVIITADLFEKIKRESVRAAEQKLRGARNE